LPFDRCRTFVPILMTIRLAFTLRQLATGSPVQGNSRDLIIRSSKMRL